MNQWMWSHIHTGNILSYKSINWIGSHFGEDELFCSDWLSVGWVWRVPPLNTAQQWIKLLIHTDYCPLWYITSHGSCCVSYELNSHLESRRKVAAPTDEAPSFNTWKALKWKLVNHYLCQRVNVFIGICLMVGKIAQKLLNRFISNFVGGWSEGPLKFGMDLDKQADVFFHFL